MQSCQHFPQTKHLRDFFSEALAPVGGGNLDLFPPLCATNLQMPNLAFASMTSVLPCQLVSLKLAPAGRICSQTCYAGT